MIPQRPSFVFAPDQVPIAQGQALGPALPTSESIQYARSNVDRTPQYRTSLLRQHLEANDRDRQPSLSDGHVEAGAGASSDAGRSAIGRDFREQEQKAPGADPEDGFHGASPYGESSARLSIFAIPPHLATPPIFGSYSSYRSYGTVGSETDGRPTITTVWQQAEEGTGAEEELQPVLVREVEQDGKFVLTVEGQSTLPQTVFNSINVLIGVGLLSLPLGLKYAGWLCGMAFLFFSALVTAYTAKLLARCMDLDPSLITFSDVAYISFGTRARVFSSVLFTLELMAANVALVVLFADSLDLLFPGLMSLVQWKMACTVILIPLTFLPLRLLSFTSVIGIVSCICSKSLTRRALGCMVDAADFVSTVVLIVIIDGLIKPHTPGSLIEPAATYLLPARWSTLPLSFGLLLSPWGGHSVFPNVGYKRHLLVGPLADKVASDLS